MFAFYRTWKQNSLLTFAIGKWLLKTIKSSSKKQTDDLDQCRLHSQFGLIFGLDGSEDTNLWRSQSSQVFYPEKVFYPLPSAL